MRTAVFLFLYLLAGAAGAAAAPRNDAEPYAALWDSVRAATEDGRFNAADQVVLGILDAARRAGDADAWTRALIEHGSLATARAEPVAALEALRTTPWPDDPFARTMLALHYARRLKDYQNRYAREIRQREGVVGADSLAFADWGLERFAAEIDAAMGRAWRLLEAWEDDGRDWQAYLDPGSYPAGIRDTPRDAVAYLWTGYLADTALWTPPVENAARKMDLEALMTAPCDSAGTLDAAAPGGAVHPLRRMGQVLAGLRARHLARGRSGAALEAELEDLRRLYQIRHDPRDRERITVYLQTRLAEVKAADPWWSLGKWQLARFLRQDPRADALVRAHLAAVQGERRHPDSVGGRLCAALRAEIEVPSFDLAAQSVDAPGRRTIQIRHRNLARLHFRAWRHDVRDDWTAKFFRGRGERIAGLPQRAPDLAWDVDLPPTPDYREHVTWTGLPDCLPGAYVVAAATADDFDDEDAAVRAIAVTISDLVVTAQPLEDAVEILVRAAGDGSPVPGAEVRLRARRRLPGEETVAITDAQGRVLHPVAGRDELEALVTRGDQAVFMGGIHESPDPDDAPVRSALVYVDRGAYRPGQTVQWKVVAYDGNAERTGFHVAAQCTVTVRLQDANRETVAEQVVVTNDFGSASGSFPVPPDRLRGHWSITTDPDGRANFRVEDYKRPTFEVTLADPGAPLAPGRAARVEGRAGYLFGAAVSGAEVSWRVRRSIQGWAGWFSGYGGGEVVAEGRAVTDASGVFVAAFAAEDLPDSEPGVPRILAYTVEADVTDPGGETRSDRRTYLLGTTSIVATLEGGRGFLAAGVPDTVAVLRTDLDRVPRAGTGRWTLYALVQPERTRMPSEWPNRQRPKADPLFATPGDSLRSRWETRPDWRREFESWPRGDAVAAGTVHHGDDGRAVIAVTAPAPGAYQLVYETEDDRGRPSRATLPLIAGGGTGGGALRLSLVVRPQTASVAVGDTARILVHSGLPSSPVRLQVFVAGRRVRDEFLPAGLAGGRILALPVTAAMHRGLRVDASVIRDHELVRDDASVMVPWSEKELKVEFASFRDRVQPGDRESFTIRVTGPDAAAAAAEVLALMYDRSLDAIAPHRLPDPVDLYARYARYTNAQDNVGRNWRGWARRPDRHRPDTPLLLPGGLVPFPGSFVDLRMDRYGRVGPFSISPAVRRRLAREGVPILEPFEVEGAEYMVEVKSAVNEQRISSETFEKYAIDSSVEPLSMLGGGQLYVRGGRRGDVSFQVVAMELPPPPDLDEVAARQDFAETAFFLPHVELDGQGSAVITFEAPEAVTEWVVKVQALTPDLRAGSAQRTLRTAKDLLVRPYLPRFLREGDLADLRVVVSNAGATELDGRLRLELEDPATGRDLAADFALSDAERPFRVDPGGLATITYRVRAPAAPGEVVVRAVGAAASLSDGEQRALPVLPGRTHLIESRFAALGDSTRRTLRFAAMASADPTRVNDQLAVTVDMQLLNGVLRAVPYLVDYPYECTEQTLNRYLASGILGRVYGDDPAIARLAGKLAARDSRWERWDDPDPNRRLLLEETPWLRESAGGDDGHPLLNLLRPEVAERLRAEALARLGRLQNADGGFPWFPGGESTPHMTLYLLMGLARAGEFGLEVPDDLTRKAWLYLHGACIIPDDDDDLPLPLPHLVLLSYVLSAYPDDAVSSAGFTRDLRTDLLDRAWRHRLEVPRTLKAHLALALHRAGRRDEARRVWASLMDAAKSDPDLGVYWAPEDRSWLWYNDTIEGHAFALRAAAELAPDDPRRAGLAQWLLLNRHLNQWKSTRATAEALYALVHHLRGEGTLGIREAVRVQVGAEDRTFVADPDDPTTGRARLVLTGDAIDGKTMHTVTVSRESPGLAFVSATWQYSTSGPVAAADGDLFGVTRRFFLCRVEDGRDVLVPLREGDPVAMGDKIEVQLSVRARAAAEYVHLRDPRPAGCEPEDAVSGHRRSGGLGYYREMRDSAANFFIPWLPTGEYTLHHRLRAATAGTFRVQPAVLQSMYAPEFAAHSAGGALEITAGRR